MRISQENVNIGITWDYELIWLQWLCESSHWFQLERKDPVMLLQCKNLGFFLAQILMIWIAATIDKWGMTWFVFTGCNSVESIPYLGNL